MLTIELVPRTAHGVNLRSAGSRRQWEIIKALTLARAGHRCEICAAPALERHPLETHEVWDWDEVMAEQRLRHTVALCTWCHRCKHPALAERLGLSQRVHAHIRRVNDWTQEQLDGERPVRPS